MRRPNVANRQLHRWPPHAFCRCMRELSIVAELNSVENGRPGGEFCCAACACACSSAAAAALILCWISWGLIHPATGTIGPVVEHGVAQYTGIVLEYVALPNTAVCIRLARGPPPPDIGPPPGPTVPGNAPPWFRSVEPPPLLSLSLSFDSWVIMFCGWQ